MLEGLKGTLATHTFHTLSTVFLKFFSSFSQVFLKRRQRARIVPKTTQVQESCQVFLCNSHANLKGLG